MKYRRTKHKKWKWQLIVSAFIVCYLYVEEFETEYFNVKDGILNLKSGYAIDGVTAWFDFHHLLHGAFAHDALLQAIDLGLIPEEFRDETHRYFYGVNKPYCDTWYKKLSLQVAYRGLVALHRPFHYISTKMGV